MMLKKELLDILCCPKCRGDLAYNEPAATLTCKECRRVYPVKDGIPIMLVEEDKTP
ncbi:MAG: Trm112 family protein [Ignavibacteria bacterium]|nr:Trm112 family protein [Ignavibacteria bacterium]